MNVILPFREFGKKDIPKPTGQYRLACKMEQAKSWGEIRLGKENGLDLEGP